MSLLDSLESRPQVPPLGTLVRLLSEAVGNRAELLGWELEETTIQLGVAAALAGVVVSLVQFAGFAFTLTVAALVWDSPHRAAWLGGLTGGYLIAGAIVGAMLWGRLKAWRPFAETKSQLNQDHQCLRDLSKAILH